MSPKPHFTASTFDEQPSITLTQIGKSIPIVNLEKGIYKNGSLFLFGNEYFLIENNDRTANMIHLKSGLIIKKYMMEHLIDKKITENEWILFKNKSHLQIELPVKINKPKLNELNSIISADSYVDSKSNLQYLTLDELSRCSKQYTQNIEDDFIKEKIFSIKKFLDILPKASDYLDLKIK